MSINELEKKNQIFQDNEIFNPIQQSNSCRNIRITLFALGIILLLGAITLKGLHISKAFPSIITSKGPFIVILPPLAVGVIFTSVGAYLLRSKTNKVTITTKDFPTYAEENVRFVLNHHNEDPRRFHIVGNEESPLIQKVSGPRYLMRCIFIPKAKYTSSLQEALNRSVAVLNSTETSTPSQQILAAKYNRFTQTSTVLKSISNENASLTPMGKQQREWGHFDKTVKENNDHLTQPVFKKGKWYHMENQANHGMEAAIIFAETQSKRFSRLLSFNLFFKYFSQNESESDIYMHEEPLLNSDQPLVQNIGHATLLFQMGGINILTDPTFGGLNPIFYPRKTKPGLKPHELPAIDVILISHNHRDHCDIDSLKELVPHQPILLIPRGDFALFKDLGFTHVQEHDWWTTTTISCNGENVDFYSVPARHWSGRGAFDAQKSLMCSWVFKRKQDKGAVYFRGDTANIPDKTMQEIIHFVKAPIMANFEPGGPNHGRRWMESTHQSVLDSIVSCMTVNEKLEDCTTYLMHHNAYELGTDRFNEAVIIKDQIVTFLKTDLSYTQESFQVLPKFVQKELQGGVLERIQKFGKEKFVDHLNQRFLSPKIGQRLPLTLK